MTVTLEQFAASLIKNISDRTSNRTGSGYVLGSVLTSSIQMALVPPNTTIEFPRMLYRSSALGSPDETCIVNDNEELLEKMEQGWSGTPSPEPPGYPQGWLEVDPSRGSDYRRVQIRNTKELQLFSKSPNSIPSRANPATGPGTTNTRREEAFP